MTKQVQRRRGTASQHTSFTGAEGEISVNTTNKSVHVHDGVTAGGVEAARADLANVSDASLNTALAGNTLSSLTITSADINGGTIDGTVIGGTTPAAVTATSLTATGTTTLAGASTTANITFGDNDKAIFGAGSDLQIYHDGATSFIDDVGTGNLVVKTNGGGILFLSGAENLASFVSNGAVNLYYDNSKKLATTSTGVDVTGTVTADGLTVGGNIFFDSTSGALRFRTTEGVEKATARLATNDLKIETSGLARTLFAANGDISFYEDTGTTPKMVWSASAETLSIGSGGTATPAANLIINDSAASGFKAKLTSSAFNVDGNWLGLGMGYNNGYLKSAIIAEAKDGNARTNLHFALDSDIGSGNVGLADAKMTITYGGNVGIGTSSPSAAIHLDVVSPEIRVEDSNNGTGGTAYRPNISFFAVGTEVGSVGMRNNRHMDIVAENYNSAQIRMFTGGSVSATIDASGNLLVGKTSAAFGTQGIALRPVDGVSFTRSSGSVLDLNRLSTNGEIIGFYKDGTTVGSIGSRSVTGGSATYVQLGLNGEGFAGSNLATIAPANGGSLTDGVLDLGSSGARFDDIYATNALIQTSDRNEKQDIAELDEAERRVAVAAKGLLRKFRWRDAVAEKGDDARIHFGIIAQDLQAAFAAEGLDAGKYAMFIHTTWTDEETGEERSRMGVRYSELLAFIIAAI